MVKQARKVHVWIEKLFPGILFISILFIMLLEVFSRKLFNKSFPWSIEYCRFALVWLTFIGSVYVRRERSHIKVGVLYDYCVKREWTGFAFAMDVLSSLLAIMFWILLIFYGWRLSIRVGRIVSPAFEISLFWLYICTFIGGLLAVVMEVIEFAGLLFGKKGREQEAERAAKEEEETI
ncbi:MAG: TRAP transporter small permease [Planctomycetes bacterium]|nr:TRAP transporter small permease [Planctomycetota bacterium]